MAKFAVSPGRPDYSGNFIPEIWSGKLIENFYDATVLSAISNTDYEGEIRQMVIRLISVLHQKSPSKRMSRDKPLQSKTLIRLRCN